MAFSLSVFQSMGIPSFAYWYMIVVSYPVDDIRIYTLLHQETMNDEDPLMKMRGFYELLT